MDGLVGVPNMSLIIRCAIVAKLGESLENCVRGHVEEPRLASAKGLGRLIGIYMLWPITLCSICTRDIFLLTWINKCMLTI